MFAGLVNWLFDPAGLTAHGFCLLWNPGLIWTYAISDLMIGIAYFTIPVALAIVARGRRDLVFRPLFWLFAAFILLCGTTHFLDVVTLWYPLYGIQGVAKAATAVGSLGTAIGLWWLLPQVLALPSHAQLSAANMALRASEERLHQAQKMEAVGQLTGGIAHDINNVLQGIAGCLDMLGRRIADGRIQDTERYLQAGRRAVDSGARLVHRLLAFARRQALQPAAIEPDKLIQSMEELFSRSLGPTISVQMKLRDGSWSALCDPNQLENVLLNLAINARDAMPDGGTFIVTTDDRELREADLGDQTDVSPGCYVEIAVADTGIGMPPEVASRVFEPFFTTKPPGQGTGLGLSQAYGFARQSGGFIRLESIPGQGTTVRIYLPRHANVPDGNPAAPPVPGTAPTWDAKAVAETVVVVDDEDDVRTPIVDFLRSEGYDVLEASDGPSGLQVLLTTAQVSVLVTDVGLPGGLNGRQLADAARLQHPSLAVLFITGYSGTALENMPYDAVTDVILKPFAIETLVGKIRALRAGRRIANA